MKCESPFVVTLDWKSRYIRSRGFVVHNEGPANLFLRVNGATIVLAPGEYLDRNDGIFVARMDLRAETDWAYVLIGYTPEPGHTQVREPATRLMAKDEWRVDAEKVMELTESPMFNDIWRLGPSDVNERGNLLVRLQAAYALREKKIGMKGNQKETVETIKSHIVCAAFNLGLVFDKLSKEERDDLESRAHAFSGLFAKHLQRIDPSPDAKREVDVIQEIQDA